MPLFREENFLVIHVGSQDTLFLFGLSESLTPPQYKIPSIVYFDKSTNEYRASNTTGTLDKIFPVVESRIVNVGAFQALIKFVLQTIISRHPIITINQIPLLLIAPSISYSRDAVEQITKYVFETLEFTAFNVLDLSIGTTFGLGATSSSLVINIGHESTQIVPVIGGSVIKYSSKRLAVGGNTINEELSKLLPNFTPAQIDLLKRSNIYEVLLDHTNTFYTLADLKEASNDDDEIDVAKTVLQENGGVDTDTQNDGKQNNELQTNYFMEGGNKISVGKERFQGATKLISLIAEGIFETLSKIPDLDKRQECFDNLIFVGGTSNISGLKQAIVLQLCMDHLYAPSQTKKQKNDLNGVNSAIAAYQQTDDIADSNGEHNGTLQVPSSIKLMKYPDYFPEWKKPKENFTAWCDAYFLGGEIYSKQIFGANSNFGGESFLDTDIYEERGPQAIWDVVL